MFWPDLDPNCFQRLSAEDKLMLAGKELNLYIVRSKIPIIPYLWHY